jgi:O-antigen/teichoic acid export membrane protein
MKLRRNIIANYVSQGYAAAAGILTVPAYVKYMGAEAYGLVGFYGMLQAWFLILDAGLSTTLSREVARYNGGGTSAATLTQLKRLLVLLFAAVAVLGVAAFGFGASTIASKWLKVTELALGDVVQSIQLMGLIIALRWMSCLYRGVVSGFEQQVWLSGFTTVVTTLRFVLSIPVVACVDSRPTTFFLYQAVVSSVEVAVLMYQSSRVMPRSRDGEPTGRDWSALKPALKFASGVAFTSVVWVLVTQVDKLALSKLLPLRDYGEFALAVLLASGINMLSGPISTALIPRLTSLTAGGNQDEVRTLYRSFTQIVCVATLPAALTLFVFAREILFAWTGNAVLAGSASSILGLYALGNAVLGIAAFPYYLQYAKGDIRLHLIGNAVFVVLYLPFVLLAAQHLGGAGAAWAWLGMNLLYLALWVPVVHGRLAPGLHGSWLVNDVGRILVAACLPFLALLIVDVPVAGRFSGAAVAACYGVASLACALGASHRLRSALLAAVRRPARIAT